MCSTVLPCPLCCQPNFPTIDSLRISLVSVTSRPLVCPICCQLQMGLDKLTIHLFSHSLPCEPILHQFSNPNHQSQLPGISASVGLSVYTEEHTENRRDNHTDKPIIKCCNRRAQPNAFKSSDVNDIRETMNTFALESQPEMVTQSQSLQQLPQQRHEQLQQQQNSPQIKQQQSPLHYERPVKVEVFEMGPGDRMSHSSSKTTEPTCIICGFTFRNQELHQMHMQLVHEIHVNDDTDENYTLGGVTAAERLVEDAHGPRNDSAVASDGQAAKSRFQCHLCPKNFKMKGSLRVHLRVMHTVGGMVASLLTPKPVESDQMSLPGNPDNNCSTKTIALIQSHFDGSSTENRGAADVEEMLATTMMGSPMPSPATSAHSGGVGGWASTVLANGSDTKLWECDICAKSFTTKYFLKKHKRLHTGEMPYTCDLCGKTFTFQQSYHKHLLYHNDDKPHVCNTCGRAFKELSTLHNHERIHSGEKPFKCETCDKCFRQRVSYLVHRRIHTGVMPYKCTACDKSFRYKVSQRTHKCLAQPPGEVIRQTGDLLQRLIQSAGFNQATDNDMQISVDDNILQEHPIVPQSDTTSKTKSEERTIEDDVNQTFINQSLDELLAEHCEKIGIGNEDGGRIIEIPMNVMYDKRKQDSQHIPSPSDQFQHMGLYSPTSLDDGVSYSGVIETIDDTALNRFLFGNE